MSNQYNKYIANIISSNLQETIQPGDRFFIRFEQDFDVIEMLNSFKEMKDAQDFTYHHSQGTEYRTISISINGINLVIASNTGGVTPDYLVTLRNLVGEQNGVWKNTALLTLLVGQLDSIEGGSKNLEVEGLPLHPTTIFKELESELQNSSLENYEKVVVRDSLDMLIKESTVQKVSFLDFVSLFEVLQNKYISDEDYASFGLFKDTQLDTYKGSSQMTRLNENRRLFNEVKEAHEYGSEKSRLEDNFSPKGTDVLLDESWESTPFPSVIKFHEDYKKLKKDKKIIYQYFKAKENVEIWDRSHSDTTAGKRTRYIIVFNPEQYTEINIEVGFDIQGDIKFKNEFITQESPRLFSTSGNKIRGKITDASSYQFHKIIYKHEKVASLGASLYVLVLPIPPSMLEQVKSKYKIDKRKGDLLFDYDDDVLIGDGLLYNKKEFDISTNNQQVLVTSDDLFDLVLTLNELPDDGKVSVNLEVENTKIPLTFNSVPNKSVPIKGFKLWHDIRENNLDAVWNTESDRIIFDHQEFYLDPEYTKYWSLEKQWIENLPMMHGKLDGDNLSPIDLIIGDELREAYSRFVNIFHKKSDSNNSYVIPSLATVDDEFIERANDFIEAYSNEINIVKSDKIAGKRRLDLFKLGTLITDHELLFTPFHPIMIAYKLEMYDKLKFSNIDRSILKRLTPESLIPFAYFPDDTDSNKLLSSSYTYSVMEWLFFEPTEEISVSDASQYLAKVVSDKLTQFKKHFSYLFFDQSVATYRVNVVEIENDTEVLIGLVEWLYAEAIKNGVHNMTDIEVTLYRNTETESAFDKFQRIKIAQEIRDLYDIKLYGIDQHDEDEVLRNIQNKISYYKKDIDIDFDSAYAHVTFYKMDPSSQFAIQKSSSMRTGVALDGLSCSVPSMHDQTSAVYKSGFGLKGYGTYDLNMLLETTVLVNELAANLSNNGNDTYRSDEVILATSNTIDEGKLSKILASSHWVTLVDPIIDLDFFETISEAIVIHYSDQYSSSSKLDAVTITSKSEQYYKVIKDFLKSKDVVSTQEQINSTVKAFNTFNGEWLLKIIGSKGHYDREKLSIISAIKYTLAYYNHEDILWVPISLEEILRIAGAVGLSQKDGALSAKNLGLTGSHSDDLLLLGLEQRDEQNFLHFYPIEVKIGINSSNVIQKATEQVLSTYKGLMGAFAENSFREQFHKNFFIELFISNAKKIDKSGLWPSKNFKLSEDTIEQLLRNNVSIGDHLLPFIGKGAILSFKKEQAYRSVDFNSEIMQINLTEEDGYQGVTKDVDDIRKWIENEDSDFRNDQLLSKKYQTLINTDSKNHIISKSESSDLATMNMTPPIINDKNTKDSSDAIDIEHTSAAEVNPELNDSPEITAAINIEEVASAHEMPERFTRQELSGKTSVSEAHEVTKKPIILDAPVAPSASGSKNIDLKNIRIKIGTAQNSNKEIFWEFGNPGLANRHLLISGGSGQGKTYFMQCLLLEQARAGISNIVVDYTEGFLPNQLEPEFIDYMDKDKFKVQWVIQDKLPINPFRKNMKDLGGIEILESNVDVAERVKSVFATVYSNLGIQQQNAIYEAVIEGLEMYEDAMTFLKMKSILEEAGTSYAKTALSTIRPLIDRDVFDFKTKINWEDVLNSDGEVFVIQLTSYNRDVQLIITEFILWDLWNYSVQNGNKDKPMPVLLDEAQNLDFDKASPSGRILTEGRKFGWSAWYATQFLKSQLNSDELARLQNAAQKIYFKPPEQELTNIANSLSKDPGERKLWENKLASLKKGQCIVHSPILNDHGELTASSPIVVDITSLAERIN
ncbi:DNA phosphorothioation-dependent restriction protein DptH [Sporosarcina ureae]|uniref:Helicase HerA central domain-containing protein n=1 Tax=Sporosarcina ureae TaxID=1571 RepID=A0ABM6JV35_SPOUR|nr:DNA phosphorothioation-dependent restriction protein DptH [Sporosarcina ureae]ARF14010.1 hypothetical protein SporoS204_07535 [Sporosarcina ureae]